MKRLLLVTLFVVSVPFVSYAWNYEGHMTVAAIAYSTLSSEERQNVDSVLQNHPWYAKWRGEHQQLHLAMPLPLYAFMRAATWPDDIRNTDFDRPPNHYINFPLNPPNSINTNTSIGGNLFPAMKNALASMASQPTSPAKKRARAIELSWLLHLTGDLHQPLHAAALRNNTYPQGDRGGNLFFVRAFPGGNVLKLHSFWDGILGRSEDATAILAFAVNLANQLPASGFSGQMGGDYRSWSAESAQLALVEAYQFTLPNGNRASLPGSNNPNQGPVVPAGYEQNTRRVAQRRVALGGYRLGMMLSQFF